MSISLSEQTTTPVKTLVQDQHLPLQKEPTLSTFWRHTLHCRFFLKVFSLKTWGSPFPPCTHTRKTHTDTGKRDSQSVSNLIQNQKWRCDPWSCLLSKTPCLNHFLTFTQELDLADVKCCPSTHTSIELDGNKDTGLSQIVSQKDQGNCLCLLVDSNNDRSSELSALNCVCYRPWCIVLCVCVWVRVCECTFMLHSLCLLNFCSGCVTVFQ